MTADPNDIEKLTESTGAGLTERLRDTGNVFARSPYHDLLDEAADAIEALTAEVAGLEDICDQNVPDWRAEYPVEATDV